MRKLSTRDQMAYRTIATLELERDATLAREAALREELAKSNELLSQARGMVNGATDEWHDEAQKLTGEK